ncbi:gamma-glutamylcyclotransferase family protein [Agromyces salentinus]|uniref:Gamma-glutamylcyclotransferase AIG2-like domain-containing protein n=1 Tax=Agromyces salentinus TaxID=269421 RepID=A0ABN2MRM2_9MICO|nr:gamma-glutamylcyclotransferase family protein [Agromyces salentinus]
MSRIEHLFSYGTLRLPHVQRETFGAELPTAPDALVGWRIGVLRITDAAVLALSGEAEHPILEPTGDPDDRVEGSVLQLTPSQLAAADRYEVDDYVREPVALESGLDAWVYVAAGSARARSDGMEVDEGDEPRFTSPDPCPQCGGVLDGGVLAPGGNALTITLRCLSCGYSALVDPFA